MKKCIYVYSSIIVLTIIFVMQYSYLLKTQAKDILDVNRTSYYNDYFYDILAETTSILLEDVERTRDDNITYIFNAETNPYYEYGIGYLMLRMEVLPMFMPNIGGFATSYENKKDIIENYDLDYILVMGKDTPIYNQTTTNDYTLYKVISDDEIEEVKSVSFGLYTVYKDCLEKDDMSKINYYVDKYKKEYIKNNTPSTYMILRTYAVELFDNGYYEEAMDISSFYLENVYQYDATLNYNMGYMYEQLEEYEKALEYYKISAIEGVDLSSLIYERTEIVKEKMEE